MSEQFYGKRSGGLMDFGMAMLAGCCQEIFDEEDRVVKNDPLRRPKKVPSHLAGIPMPPEPLTPEEIIIRLEELNKETGGRFYDPASGWKIKDLETTVNRSSDSSGRQKIYSQNYREEFLSLGPPEPDIDVVAANGCRKAPLVCVLADNRAVIIGHPNRSRYCHHHR